MDDRFKVSRDTVLSRLVKYHAAQCDHLLPINAVFFDQVSALYYMCYTEHYSRVVVCVSNSDLSLHYSLFASG